MKESIKAVRDWVLGIGILIVVLVVGLLIHSFYCVIAGVIALTIDAIFGVDAISINAILGCEYM